MTTRAAAFVPIDLEEGQVYWQVRYKGKDYGAILATTYLDLAQQRVSNAIGDRIGRQITETLKALTK